MKYDVIAYFDKEIKFYRTTSNRKLEVKINELKENNIPYNKITIYGWNTSFSG